MKLHRSPRNCRVELEINRRNQAKRVIEFAWKRDIPGFTLYDGRPGEDSDSESEHEPEPPFTRFNKIRDYLFGYRRELALETLHITMGEHVFMSHIRNQGAIKLRPDELRAFLKTCNERKEPFRYVD
jgi:hypothetical protein